MTLAMASSRPATLSRVRQTRAGYPGGETADKRRRCRMIGIRSRTLLAAGVVAVALLAHARRVNAQECTSSG
jgi:hypothetical protein